MNGREPTTQQLDPLGGLAARPLILVGCAAAVVYVIVMTVLNSRDIDYPGVAVAGIAIVVAAAAAVAVGSSPLRAPLGRAVHFSAMGLGLIALVLNAVSMWESNASIRDDWGSPALGFLSLTLVPYRPPREIAAVGALAGIFAGFVALLQADALQIPGPPMIFVIIAATPVLAMSWGGAAFASTVIRMLRRWQSRASSAVLALADERKAGLTRSVQQDRVTILNRDVVPFFEGLLERADLLDADRARAAEIADSIRRVMVAEVDRSWLDLVVEQAAGASGAGGSFVADPGHLAAAMSTDQRTALRAAIVAIFEHPEFDRRGFAVRLVHEGQDCAATIRARFTTSEWGIRTDLAPYLAVLRVVFAQLRADFSPSALTVRFSYDKQ